MAAPGNALFVEKFQIADGWPPQAISSKRSGDWMNLSHMHALIVQLHKSTGNASDPIYTLFQSKSNTGTDSKVLVLPKGRIWGKIGTTTGNQLYVKQVWENLDADYTAAGVLTNDEWGDHDTLITMEVRPEDLDEGFNHVHVVSSLIASATSVLSAQYICDMKTHRAPDKMLSVL